MSTNLPSKSPIPTEEKPTVEDKPVTTVGEDKIEAKQILFQLAADQRQQREEIDSIKVGLEQIMEKVSQLIDVQNQTSKILGGGQTENPQVQASGVNHLMTIKELLDSKLGDKILSRVFPENNIAGPALISQDVINEKMTRAFMDDLDTGESIRKFISDSLKKRATKEIVNQSLGSIGQVSHEPE